MQTYARVADADSVAVDDLGDTGQRRLDQFLGFGRAMAMVITGLTIVVAAFLVQATGTITITASKAGLSTGMALPIV